MHMAEDLVAHIITRDNWSVPAGSFHLQMDGFNFLSGEESREKILISLQVSPSI